MKHFFILLIFVCLLFAGCKCEYHWLWAKNISSGDAGNKLINNIATDQNDNVIVIGSFQNNGNNDVFIRKYGPLGNLLWTQIIGGSGAEQADGIATDPSGNIYVSGAFNSPTLFDKKLNNSGAFDFFVAKYDTNGKLLWAQSAAGTENDGDNGTRLVIDENSNVYVSARYMGDTLELFSQSRRIVVSNKRASGLFLAKYNPNGNLIWAKSTTGIMNDAVGDIAVDKYGDVYQTGFYMSNMDFDSTHRLSAGSFHIFFAKYNSTDGTLDFAHDLGVGRGYGIACDEDNNIYVTGLNLGNLSLPGKTAPALKDNSISLSTGDFFLAKYNNASSSWDWLRTAGGNYQEFGKGVTYKNGLVWVTGAFNSQALSDFGGSVTLQNSTSRVTNENVANQFDVFLATYNKKGDLITATKIGSNDSESGTRIVIDTKGEACILGCFNSEKLDLGNHIVPREDQRVNLFVAKCRLDCIKK